MKIFWLIIFILITITLDVHASCRICHAIPPIEVNKVAVIKAKSHLNIREAKNNNRHPDIDKFHRYYGLPYGNPWCMMFVGYSYYEAFAEYNMKSPIYKTARVSTFTKHALKNTLTYKVISTKKIIWGADTLRQGDLVIFKHGKITPTDNFSWDGHIEMGIERKNKNFICIGGNTKPSNSGDQTGRVKGDTKYGNDGVYIRERSINLNSKFPIVYIVRLKRTEF